MTTPTIQERIELGQAKNQASEILKLYITKNPLEGKDKYKEFYQRWVGNFTEWNKEIDLKAEGGVGHSDLNTPSDTKTSHPQPSIKQKYCLKCKTIIPKTWKRHEECGWSE